jgi:hypothetical protein
MMIGIFSRLFIITLYNHDYKRYDYTMMTLPFSSFSIAIDRHARRGGKSLGLRNGQTAELLLKASTPSFREVAL